MWWLDVITDSTMDMGLEQSLGVDDGQEKPSVLQSMGSQELVQLGD